MKDRAPSLSIQSQDLKYTRPIPLVVEVNTIYCKPYRIPSYFMLFGLSLRQHLRHHIFINGTLSSCLSSSCPHSSVVVERCCMFLWFNNQTDQGDETEDLEMEGLKIEDWRWRYGRGWVGRNYTLFKHNLRNM